MPLEAVSLGFDPTYRRAVLPLELSTATNLQRRSPVLGTLREELADLRSRKERHGLILIAANTFLPDASVCSLPTIAKEEVEAGLTGSLRCTLAAADDSLNNLAALTALAEGLMEAVAGSYDTDSALSVALNVHLSRVAAAITPPPVGLACLAWYGSYKSSIDSHAELFLEAENLVERWVVTSDPATRVSVQETMHSLAISHVGVDRPDALNLIV